MILSRQLAAVLWAVSVIWPISVSRAAISDIQGSQLAANCASCHTAAGHDSAVPVIVGLDENRAKQMLLSFRSGTRRSQVMQVVASALTPEEIESVAHYLAGRGAALP